jgi:hypothetical protein
VVLAVLAAFPVAVLAESSGLATGVTVSNPKNHLAPREFWHRHSQLAGVIFPPC